MNNILKNVVIRTAVANAILTALYISVIAIFFFYGPAVFGTQKDNFLMPMIMLMLLVLSASITGFLIFGRPVLWYLDGKKDEAMLLLGYTLVIFFAITILALIALYVLA